MDVQSESRELTRAERISFLREEWGPDCILCEKPFDSDDDITIEHWMPQSWCKKQGWTKEQTWDLSNLRLAHKKCNAIKGDRLPNEDGTLPPLKREIALANRRAVRRGNRPELCGKCDNGRMLGPQESCNVCGSGPMPERWPRWAKVRPNECDHSEFWCWICGSGIVERTSVITNLITGE